MTLNYKHYFQGDSTITEYLSFYGTHFTIENIADTPLSFTINNSTIYVEPNTLSDYEFSPFNTVTVEADGDYRAYVCIENIYTRK